MNPVLLRVLAVVALISSPGPLFAQARRGSATMGKIYTAEFEFRRWGADLVSEIRLSGDVVPGSTLDTWADLGLPSERIWDYHLAVRLLKRLKIRGSWYKVDYFGESISSEDRKVAGLEESAGAILASAFEFEEQRGGAEFDIFQGLHGYLAIVGEFAMFNARPSFESLGEEARQEALRIQLPVFGAKGRLYLTPTLSVAVEAVGMKRQSEGVMMNFEVQATYNAIPNFGFSYGYRNSYNRVKNIEESGDRAVFRLRGQYFGVLVLF
jgi:hypothetical protein